MPRYHFTVHDGASTFDRDGTELPDMEAARTEAFRLAGQIIADAAHAEGFAEAWHIDVTDSAGLVLFRMDFNVAESPAAAGWRSRPERLAHLEQANLDGQHRPTAGEAIQAARIVLARKPDDEGQG